MTICGSLVTLNDIGLKTSSCSQSIRSLTAIVGLPIWIVFKLCYFGDLVTILEKKWYCIWLWLAFISNWIEETIFNHNDCFSKTHPITVVSLIFNVLDHFFRMETQNCLYYIEPFFSSSFSLFSLCVLVTCSVHDVAWIKSNSDTSIFNSMCFSENWSKTNLKSLIRKEPTHTFPHSSGSG